MKEKDNTVDSLSHTKWNCKYHIVFAPKYRRKVFYADKREEIREILKVLCKWIGDQMNIFDHKTRLLVADKKRLTGRSTIDVFMRSR